MTKKQKIQSAYGKYWEQVKNYVDDNGWCDFKAIFGDYGNCKGLPGIELKVSDPYDPKYCYFKRPISISGITDNNGWIKIESMDSFPKETIFCVTCIFLDTENYQIGTLRNRTPTDLLNMWQYAELTHYKIYSSKSPIY